VRQKIDRPWSDNEIATLRTMWGAGVRTVEIGRKLKRNKHSIIGKAHRLGLPSRPSPITFGPQPRQYGAVPLAHGARTLPPLPSEMLPDAP
jgi:hypothetical protein